MKTRHWYVLAIAICVLANARVIAQAAPGFRLVDPLGGNVARLVDVNGVTVHSWTSAFLNGGGDDILPDGTLLRGIQTPGLPPIGGAMGGVERLAIDGTVLWSYRYDGPNHWNHHDIEPLPNGNVLLIAWDNKTIPAAIDAGRIPGLAPGNVMRADSVVEVQPTGPTTGTIVWEWHLWDHLVQDADPTKANFGTVAQHPELMDINFPPIGNQIGDWNHCNSIDYDAAHDWVILSSHNQSEVWIIDHSTTTAEAAGHTGGVRGKGGDFLWRWGNPPAYGAAASEQLFGQHSANIIRPGLPGAGHMLVFNNNPPGGTQVFELMLDTNSNGDFVLPPTGVFGPTGPSWTYGAPGFNSAFMGSCRRLPNGNTLICSTLNDRIFEVTPAGQEVWTYSTTPFINKVFQSQYVGRTLWADKETISGSAGGVVNYKLIVGSHIPANAYILLASVSGTSPGFPVNGLVLPLNYDDVFAFSLLNANSALLSHSQAALAGIAGTGAATLNLPAGAIPAGTQAHFACAVYDDTTLTVVRTTNAVPLTITP